MEKYGSPSNGIRSLTIGGKKIESLGFEKLDAKNNNLKKLRKITLRDSNVAVSYTHLDVYKRQTLQSVPHIHQESDWTFKMNPGLSSFEKIPQEAYKSHIKPLLDFAKDIIPESHWSNCPVFIQATAGMRLLPQDKQSAILENLCQGLKHSSEFLIKDCSSQIQVIDGETEGLYGWLGLNYLYGHFNNYNPQVSKHFTFGFMDMGGASTQIAFAPHDEDQIEKHRDDIASIFLRSVNGDLQKWDVFVSCLLYTSRCV